MHSTTCPWLVKLTKHCITMDLQEAQGDQSLLNKSSVVE